MINGCKEKKKNNCKYDHIKWDDLRQKAKEDSKINCTTPEELCEKKNCNCQGHFPWINEQNICILFLKGKCPQKKCLSNHFEWESLNPKQKQINNSLQPCTTIQQLEKSFFEKQESFTLQCEKAQFLRLKQSIDQSNIIDVVFIMDLTGSMQSWKIEMEKAINEIMKQFQQTHKGYQLRFGFVGYRDDCDKDQKITYINLTADVEEIKKFISRQEAKGGGDTAEDIVAGFEQALKLNFSNHEESILCTFLIADAPCHGREYHNIQSDDLIDKVEKNYLENVLRKYQKIKECNFLCCIKINELTNIMFQKMQLVFPLLTITTTRVPQQISDQVLFTLRQSLRQSQTIQSQKKKNIAIKAGFKKYKLITKQPNYNEQNGRAQYWENFQNEIDQSLRKGETGLDIEQNINEYIQSHDQNCSTYIFKAFDSINNMFIALKIPKFIIDMGKEGKLDQKLINDAQQQAQARFYSSSYAYQMAYYFNQKTSKNQEIPPLFYALPIIYTFETPFYGMSTVYGETFINIQHKFNKYTTNHHLCEPKYYYYSVFSHFSFIESGNTFVILDLQGCDNILSDPSIQTKKGLFPILDLDQTNLNEKGIEIFLQTQHQECSKYCSQLKLSRDQFKIKEFTRIDNTQWQIEQKANLFGICDKCNELTQYNLDILKQQNQNDYSMICEKCVNESNENLVIKYNCKCCLEQYQPFLNIDLRSQSEIGRCKYCKQSCSDLNKNFCQFCKTKCVKHLREAKINGKLFNICQKGQAYLNQIKCDTCGKFYSYDVNLTMDDYNNQKYRCSNCQKG